MSYKYLIIDKENDFETIESLLDGYEMTGQHHAAILYGKCEENGVLRVLNSYYLSKETIDEEQRPEYKKEMNGHIHIYAETLSRYSRIIPENSNYFIMTLISGRELKQLSYVDPIYYGTEEQGGKRFAALSDKLTYFGGFIGLDHKMLVENHEDGNAKRWVMPVIIKENEEYYSMTEYLSAKKYCTPELEAITRERK